MDRTLYLNLKREGEEVSIRYKERGEESGTIFIWVKLFPQIDATLKTMVVARILCRDVKSDFPYSTTHPKLLANHREKK